MEEPFEPQANEHRVFIRLLSENGKPDRDAGWFSWAFIHRMPPHEYLLLHPEAFLSLEPGNPAHAAIAALWAQHLDAEKIGLLYERLPPSHELTAGFVNLIVTNRDMFEGGVGLDVWRVVVGSLSESNMPSLRRILASRPDTLEHLEYLWGLRLRR